MAEQPTKKAGANGSLADGAKDKGGKSFKANPITIQEPANVGGALRTPEHAHPSGERPAEPPTEKELWDKLTFPLHHCEACYENWKRGKEQGRREALEIIESECLLGEELKKRILKGE